MKDISGSRRRLAAELIRPVIPKKISQNALVTLERQMIVCFIELMQHSTYISTPNIPGRLLCPPKKITEQNRT